MATTDPLVKKVERLKKKLTKVKASVAGKADERETVRYWSKKLKRSQRKKKALDLKARQIETKKVKKKTSEEGKETPKTGGTTA